MNRYRLSLIAVILIALALRLYNLTYHSLWFDEAMSTYWARQSVPRILQVGFTLVEDRLPPLYYLTLKGWTAWFGFTETGVRLPSVLFGVLLIPVAAGIAAMLFNRRVALLAALLAAINPFLIWYAQEARMYAPAALYGALAVWAWLQVVRQYRYPGRRGLFTGLFILAALAGLYSHLYTGFLLPALGLWLVIAWPRERKLWLLFAASGLVITLAFTPIGLAIWRFSGEAPPGDPLHGLARRGGWLLQSFTVWKAPLPAGLKTAVPAVVALFALAGVALPARPNRSRGHRPASGRVKHPRLLVGLLLLCPFAVAGLLLFRNELAFFGERYFIVMTPWLLLLAALGATIAGEWANRGPAPALLKNLPAALLVAVTLIPLPGQWSVAASKEAWRQSVAYLANHAGANHGILIHPDWVRHPFQFYFKGPGQTYAAFSTVTPDTPLDGPLQGVVGNHPVIWLVQSHLDGPDPGRRVEQWFAARYPLVTELYPPGISIKGYAPGFQMDSLPPEAIPAGIRFETGLELAGFQADAVAPATDSLFHPPSGWVHVTLYLKAARPVAADRAPFVNLVGPEGVWGASLARSNDAWHFLPPGRWPANTIIRHDVDVNLNPDTPAGPYLLVVGLSGSKTTYPLAEVEIYR